MRVLGGFFDSLSRIVPLGQRATYIKNIAF